MDSLSQESLQNKISQSNSLVIVLSANALLDQASAALALSLGLKSKNKQISILGQPHPEWQLPAQTMIQSEIKGKNIIISWPDSQDSVAQVMTETQRDKGRFAIIIQTKNNSNPLDVDQMEFSYTGVEADLVILIGASRDAINNPELKQLTQNKLITTRLSTSEKLETDARVQEYANPSAPALTFIIWQLFKLLQVKLDPTIATLLLAGLENRTERFANPDLQPEVFIMVAECLKAGGARNYRNFTSPETSPTPQSMPALPPPSNNHQTTQLNKPVPQWIKGSIDKMTNLPSKSSPDTIREVQ